VTGCFDQWQLTKAFFITVCTSKDERLQALKNLSRYFAGTVEEGDCTKTLEDLHVTGCYDKWQLTRAFSLQSPHLNMKNYKRSGI